MERIGLARAEPAQSLAPARTGVLWYPTCNGSAVRGRSNFQGRANRKAGTSTMPCPRHHVCTVICLTLKFSVQVEGELHRVVKDMSGLALG